MTRRESIFLSKTFAHVLEGERVFLDTVFIHRIVAFRTQFKRRAEQPNPHGEIFRHMGDQGARKLDA